MAHKVVGHRLGGRIPGIKVGVNAIQTSNLFWRAISHSNVYRNGAHQLDHVGGKDLGGNHYEMEEVMVGEEEMTPSYLKP